MEPERASQGESLRPPGGPPEVVAALRMRATARALLLAILLLPAAMAPAVWASFRLSVSSRWLRHTYEVLESLYSIRAALRQATTSLHAYLGTGDEALLPQYEGAMQSAWRETWHFKELTVDNPRQVSSVTALEQNVAALLHFQSEAIAQRRSGHEPATAQRIAEEARFGDIMRDTFGALIDEERRLLREREAEMAWSTRVLEYGAAFFIGVLLLSASFAYSRLRRVISLLPPEG
jgi:CHASE3 domain sensor protein